MTSPGFGTLVNVICEEGDIIDVRRMQRRFGLGWRTIPSRVVRLASSSARSTEWPQLECRR